MATAAICSNAEANAGAEWPAIMMQSVSCEIQSLSCIFLQSQVRTTPSLAVSSGRFTIRHQSLVNRIREVGTWRIHAGKALA
jgi:hypothetical protein